MQQVLQPSGWSRPKGYANGILASGRVVFVAGQVGWNAEEQFESDDFVAGLVEAGARLEIEATAVLP